MFVETCMLQGLRGVLSTIGYMEQQNGVLRATLGAQRYTESGTNFDHTWTTAADSNGVSEGV